MAEKEKVQEKAKESDEKEKSEKKDQTPEKKDESSSKEETKTEVKSEPKKNNTTVCICSGLGCCSCFIIVLLILWILSFSGIIPMMPSFF